MPPRTSRDLKAHIPSLHYEQGYNVKEICKLLNVKKTLVYTTLQRQRSFGLSYNKCAQRQHGPRRLTSTNLSFIRALLNQQHTVYLDEIQAQLFSRRGVRVSVPTLTRTLRRLHFTHKDVSGKALKRNERHHAIYMNRIAELVTDPNMLICGDEASKDERMSNRRWSRASGPPLVPGVSRGPP
jgi:transposase